jgi:hypothetical protein
LNSFLHEFVKMSIRTVMIMMLVLMNIVTVQLENALLL